MFLVGILFCEMVFSQPIFTVYEPISTLYKTTDFGTLHNYIQISNLTTQDFPMVWISDFGGTDGCPTKWNISLNDPDSAYIPLLDGDSSTFILSGSDSLGNKLIIGVDHNGMLGSCLIGFKIYPLNNIADSINVGFDVEVTQGGGSTALKELLKIDENKIYPNPSSGMVYLTDNAKYLQVYDYLGRLLVKSGLNGQSLFDLSFLPSGVYLIKVTEVEGKEYSNQIIIE